MPANKRARASVAQKRATAQRQREEAAARSRERTQAVTDIGEIPPVIDVERRAACEFDLFRFLTSYFPQSTGLKPFSEDHRRGIERLQRCVLEGGLFVNAWPRGFAKTTVSENAAIWAILYGHRKFVPIFGSEASAADSHIASIKLELSENDLLYEDFPEIVHAIRALEGRVQRSHSQTYLGAMTHIEWRADTIVMPTIEDAPGAGGVIAAFGITGASRGMKHKRPDGTQQRPDFVLIDDPQTDESASSVLQITKRLDVIRKSLLKLGGHNRKIAAVINATVIQPGDMIEQLLDPKKFPNWQGERVKMVRSWSNVHETLWLNDYKRLRNTYDANILGDQQRAHRDATEFYQRNREAMDSGCVVSWEHCYTEGIEISAIQHAYNALIDDGDEVFASECQNEPIVPEVANSTEIASASEIAEKLTTIERGRVPLACSRVVAYVDVQKKALPWVVCAFDDRFGGSIIDYGVWPDQKKSYFSISEIPYRRSIQGVTKADGLEGQIYAALEALFNELASREFEREDGAKLKIERMAPDSRWGPTTEVVKLFCRQSPHAALLVPGSGQYCGATSRPFNEYRKQPGDRIGIGWRISSLSGKRLSRHLLFDTNYWKTFTHSRLSTPKGGHGCLMLFGKDPNEHRMIADHLTSERGVLVEAKGRKVIEWKIIRPGADNHFFDCLVGCHVLAAERGTSLIERRTQVVVPRPVSYADAVRNRKVWGGSNQARTINRR